MNGDINNLVAFILSVYSRHSKATLFTVALSGIDVAGKSTITKLLQDNRVFRGYNTKLLKDLNSL